MRAPLRVRLLLVPLVCAARRAARLGVRRDARPRRGPGAQLQAGRHVTWPPAPKPGAELEPARRRHAAARHAPAPSCGRQPRRRSCSRVAVAREPRPPSPPPGARNDALGAAPRPRRPRQPLPRPGGLRGHRRRDRQPLVRAHLARLRPLRARDPPAARPLDPLHRRRAARRSTPRSAGRWRTSTPTSSSSRSTASPSWSDAVVRLKKRRPFVLSIQTTRNYEHAFTESLVALLSAHDHETTVQLVLTPAPGFVHRRARRLLKRRERALQHADHRDPGELGIDSVVEAKELKGALELQHRSLLYFDLRVMRQRPRRPSAASPACSRSCAPRTSSRPRKMLPAPPPLRRAGSQRRCPTRCPACAPASSRPPSSPRSGSSRARASSTRALPRAAVRRAIAPPAIERDADAGAAARRARRRSRSRPRTASTDTRSSAARAAARARSWPATSPTTPATRAAPSILIDPKGPLAELCLGLAPDGPDRPLPRPRPARDRHQPARRSTRRPGARAAVFLQALIEANPPGAIQAASDSFLRQAVAAVCTVEPEPTLWHVYRMLDFGDVALPRQGRRDASRPIAGADFATALLAARVPGPDRRPRLRRAGAQPAAQQARAADLHARDRHAAAPPRHRSTSKAILERGEVLIVAGAKATVGEDNTDPRHPAAPAAPPPRASRRSRSCPRPSGGRVSLLIDEAHNVLTPSVAKMLAEGRSAGLEAVFAWQYSAQIRDEVIRSGVRSLLQSISIFRMREMEDARSLAGLAMEVYSDRISSSRTNRSGCASRPTTSSSSRSTSAINLWVADGVPRAGFVAHTLPMEALHDADARRAPPRRAATSAARTTPTQLPDPLARRRGQAAAPTREAGVARRTDAQARSRRDRATTPPERRRTARHRLRATIEDLERWTLLPASYLEAHRYDGAAIEHDRRDRARALRGAATRRRDRARRLALQVPHRAAAARALVARRRRVQAARRRLLQALRRRLPRALPARSPARGSYPVDLPPRRGRPPTPPARRRHPDRPALLATRPIYDFGHVLHELQLNAWVLAYRRALGDGAARLGRRDRHRAATGGCAASSCASTTTGQPKGYATRAAAGLPRRGPRGRRRRPARQPHCSSSSTTARGASTRTTTSSAATTPSSPGGGATRRSRDRDDAAVRALRLPGRRAARRSSSPPPTASSPATAGTRACRPSGTSTSADGESSSPSSATRTPACSRRGACPRSARTSSKTRGDPTSADRCTAGRRRRRLRDTRWSDRRRHEACRLMLRSRRSSTPPHLRRTAA